MEQKSKFALIGAALLVVLILAAAGIYLVLGAPSLGGAGAVAGISTAVIQSVSSSTYNGQAVQLVNLLGTSGSSYAIVTQLNPGTFGYNGSTLLLSANRVNSSYVYSAVQRTGPTATIPVYQLNSMSCSGYSGLWGTCNAFSNFNAFQSQCTAVAPNSWAYDAGTPGNPNWNCYNPIGQWVVSDFSRTSGQYQEGVNIVINNNDTNGPTGTYAGATLSNSMQSAPITTSTGQIVGQASMTSIVSTFQTPPSSSGIEAIRAANQQGPAYAYTLVDGSLTSAAQTAFSNFGQCMQMAQSASQTGTTNPLGIPFLPSITFQDTGSYNGPAASKCFSTYNTAINNLQNLAPTGNFAGATNNLAANGTVSITDAFSIPNINLILYNSFVNVVGIYQPVATPVSVSCQNFQLPNGGAYSINASITNGAASGGIPYSVSCTNLNVQNAGGVSQFTGPSQTNQISVPVTTTGSGGGSSCTITAQASDLSTKVSASCSGSIAAPCNLVPPPNFWVNYTTCTAYCPLQPSQCTGNTTYSNTTCTCQGANIVTCAPPLVLNGNGQCTIPPNCTATNSCPVIPPPPQNCSLFMTLVGANPGTSFLGIQITPPVAGTCAADPVQIGAVIAAIGLLMVIGGTFVKGKPGANLMVIGALLLIVGLASMGFGFIAGNALISTIGAAFVVIMVVLAIIIFILVKVGKYV